ncbi:unnamed protein product [Caretta caretta]
MDLVKMIITLKKFSIRLLRTASINGLAEKSAVYLLPLFPELETGECTRNH